MVNDIEPSILLAIAIVAILLGSIAIVLTIVAIDNNREDILDDKCNVTCGSVLKLKSNECIEDRRGNCSTSKFASFTSKDDGESYKVILAPQPKPPVEACRNFCNGIPTLSDGNPICPDTECDLGNCNYYSCLEFTTKSPECSSTQAAIVACYENIPYYLQTYDPLNTSEHCPCFGGTA